MGAAVGEQFLHVGSHDVLAQQQDGGLSPTAADLDGGPQALVGVRRGHADVSDDQLGTQLECTGYQFGSTPDGGDHLVTAVAQEQC